MIKFQLLWKYCLVFIQNFVLKVSQYSSFMLQCENFYLIHTWRLLKKCNVFIILFLGGHYILFFSISFLYWELVGNVLQFDSPKISLFICDMRVIIFIKTQIQFFWQIMKSWKYFYVTFRYICVANGSLFLIIFESCFSTIMMF